MVESTESLAGQNVRAIADMEIPKGDRGLVVVSVDHCKGCGLCPSFCPPEVLEISREINVQGYHPVRYLGSGCTGCAICFYICPEPGALTVLRREGKK
jgi:Pyruvate/2-oxoacid:ferredoxin oxidoreductase delta subunit